MSEILFYHLERQSLEQVLPLLLEKTLQRGWRAVVQAGSDERLQALSSSLWTWRDEAFLPHGSAKTGNPDAQPIWLCCDDETPNKANVRFCVDGTTARAPEDFDRTIYMFDGRNPQALELAREQWKALKDSEHERTYWQQSEQGKWEKKA
jgi:DNA polymerase-3 subunit chi